MVFNESALFCGDNKGYIKLGEWGGNEYTSLAGAEVLGIFYLCEDVFQVLAGRCPYRERGILMCNLATRLCD